MTYQAFATVEAVALYADISAIQTSHFGEIEVHFAYDRAEQAMAELYNSTKNIKAAEDLLFFQNSRANYVRRFQDKCN